MLSNWCWIPSFDFFDRVYCWYRVYQSVKTFSLRIWCYLLVACVDCHCHCKGYGPVGDSPYRSWQSGVQYRCRDRIYEGDRADRRNGGFGHQSIQIFGGHSGAGYDLYDPDFGNVHWFCGAHGVIYQCKRKRTGQSFDLFCAGFRCHYIPWCLFFSNQINCIRIYDRNSRMLQRLQLIKRYWGRWSCSQLSGGYFNVFD